MASVLYITYDGLLEPLGQSQVWRYVSRLAASHQIHLVSFEKPVDLRDSLRLQEMQALCSRHGVKWTALRYHRSPSAPATAYDIAQGLVTAFFIATRYGIDIIHARSYVPSVIG